MPRDAPQDAAGPDGPRRARDADQTRRDILAAAAAEFSEKGYAGARVGCAGASFVPQPPLGRSERADIGDQQQR